MRAVRGQLAAAGRLLADHHAAGSQGQLFSMSASGIITDATTQRVLDCRDVRKGCSVGLAAPNGSSSQRWKISPDGIISLLDAALCLDVSSKGSTAALAPLIVWTPHGRSNQRFRIVSAALMGGGWGRGLGLFSNWDAGWGRCLGLFSNGEGGMVVSACVSLAHIASLMFDFLVPAPAVVQSMPPPPPPALRACERPGCAFSAHTAQASQGNVSHCCMQCQRDGSHSISCQRFPRPIAAAAGVSPPTPLLLSAPSAPPVSSEPECQICMSEAATHAAVPCESLLRNRNTPLYDGVT